MGGWKLDLKRCFILIAPLSQNRMKIVTNGLKKMCCFPSWDFLPFRIISTEMHRVCLDVVSVVKRVKMALVLIY